MTYVLIQDVEACIFCHFLFFFVYMFENFLYFFYFNLNIGHVFSCESH